MARRSKKGFASAFKTVLPYLQKYGVTLPNELLQEVSPSVRLSKEIIQKIETQIAVDGNALITVGPKGKLIVRSMESYRRRLEIVQRVQPWKSRQRKKKTRTPKAASK
ncbi:MAG: hypothetical protein HY650_05035 [Acidobacteria bacterium]|nr:hypothetical protein [Acidobacteriota bacterium]